MTRFPRWPLIKAVSLTAFPQFFYAFPNTMIKSHINVTSVTTILFTRELLRFIMLFLHVQSSDVFQKELQSCIRHKEAWRLKICSVGNDALCAKCDNISLIKENILGRKWYVLNLGTAIFDENETNRKQVYIWQPFEARLIETCRPNSEIPGLHFKYYSSNTETLGLQHKYWDPRSTFQLLRPQACNIQTADLGSQ